MKKHMLEAATLTVIACLCALAANALAGRERKLAVTPSRLVAPSRPPVQSESGVAAIAETTSAIQEPVSGTIKEKAVASAPTPPPVTAPAATPRPVSPLATTPAVSLPKPSARRFEPHPDKAYVEIGGDDVSQLHAEKALFLDARRTAAFDDGHIAGARSFSVWESDIDEKVKKLFAERGDPQEQLKPIVIYCSGGDCEDSHMLAEKLWGLQFNNIYVYKDGFPDWQARGGRIER